MIRIYICEIEFESMPIFDLVFSNVNFKIGIHISLGFYQKFFFYFFLEIFQLLFYSMSIERCIFFFCLNYIYGNSHRK